MYSGVMYSKRSICRNTTWSAIYISLQRNIPKFDTVLLHSNWSSLRRKYLSKIPTDVNALSCGAKTWNISGISDATSRARHPQKSSQHALCVAGDGAICSKNRIIVPYHGDSPNTRNGARLRSPSPIMAPGAIKNCVLTYGQGKRRGIVSTIKTVGCGNDPVRGKNGASTPNRARLRLKV